MGYMISYVCVSHTGFCRQSNQDNFLCGKTYLPPGHTGTPKPLRGSVRPGQQALFGIFDGMGGEKQGETASYLAAKAASETDTCFRPQDALEEFCQRANDAIQCFSRSREGAAMGTTATVLSFSRRSIHLCHLGDSRAYRFRDGQLTRLTRDQVLPGCYPGKPPLARYLGSHHPTAAAGEPMLAQAPLLPEDIYLICSDGLTDMLSDREIGSILSSVPFPSAAEHLMNTALCRGGRDNVTLILCKTQKSARKPMQIKRLFSGGKV